MLLSSLISLVHGSSTGSLVVSLMRSSGGSRQVMTSVLLGGLAGTVFGGRFVTHTVLLDEDISLDSLSRILLITLALLTFGVTTGTPISYSHVLVLTAIGEILGSGGTLEFWGIVYLIVGWIVGPFIASGLTIATHASVRRLISNLDFITVNALNRLSLSVVSFAMTYVVTGNNMGFLASLSRGEEWPLPHLLIALFWTVGAVVPGRVMWDYIAERVVRISPQGVFSAAVGSSMTMLLFLHLSVPTSISHYVLASAALLPTRASLHLIGWRAVLKVVFWSVASSLLGFSAAFLLRVG